MDSQELAYFVAVAEELHFGRAAERLGMTQPPLSRAVRRLERRLGVTLLLRTSRQVRLTAAGETLLHDGRAALAALDGAARRAQRVGRRDPRLLLACKAGSDDDLLAAILDAYRRRPAALPVQVVHTATERAAMLRDGRADLALLHRPSNDLTGLDTEDLRTEPQIAVLRPDHPLAGRAELELADLRGEPRPRWPESAPDPVVAGRPVIRDHGDLIEFVTAGRGVLVVPASAIGVVPRALVCLPVRDAEPTTSVLAWAGENRSRAVASFVVVAAEVVRGGWAGQPIDGSGSHRPIDSGVGPPLIASEA